MNKGETVSVRIRLTSVLHELPFGYVSKTWSPEVGAYVAAHFYSSSEIAGIIAEVKIIPDLTRRQLHGAKSVEVLRTAAENYVGLDISGGKYRACVK